MLGTFSPQAEPYTHEMPEEITPAGIFARGQYTARSKVRKLVFFRLLNQLIWPLIFARTRIVHTYIKYCLINFPYLDVTRI